MNNKNVISLPASVNYTPEQALKAALDRCVNGRLTDVMIIGYDDKEELVILSSKMTRADGLFMVKKAEDWTMYGGLE